ncbi:hypothetical protein G9A89_002005 [Geosiphon pyriformis]|nr:hypothetical protein G9A89_002005 [Geosiphon pyriformis]
MSELLLVVNNLLDGKAAGLSGIPNELWKYYDDIVLKCLLDLLNSCLTVGDVAWVSMIPKSYDWDGIFMNTQPIAFIETARKILSKILSDHIFLAYSKFGVL